jgi:hypothetical protein
LLADCGECHRYPLQVGHHGLENKYELAQSHIAHESTFSIAEHHINLQQYT